MMKIVIVKSRILIQFLDNKKKVKNPFHYNFKMKGSP